MNAFLKRDERVEKQPFWKGIAMILWTVLFVQRFMKAMDAIRGTLRTARMIIVINYRARMARFAADNRAFSTSLVGAALGIVILAIVVLDVAIPVVTSAISTANLTGTTLTIANLIPMFLVLGLFVMVAVVFVIRWL